eukprot:COSAG06_NODE_12106_length_1423_cov_1.362538_2_plen_87_part_00
MVWIEARTRWRERQDGLTTLEPAMSDDVDVVKLKGKKTAAIVAAAELPNAPQRRGTALREELGTAAAAAAAAAAEPPVAWECAPCG